MDAVALLKRLEGIRLHAYQDVGGVWTVGYGSTGPDIHEGTTWTQEQADGALRARVAKLEHQVAEVVHVPLTPGQFAALISFSYNLGIGALRGSTLLRQLNAGNYEKASDELLRWNHVKGKVVDGLTKRRAEERALFRGEEPCS